MKTLCIFSDISMQSETPVNGAQSMALLQSQFIISERPIIIKGIRCGSIVNSQSGAAFNYFLAGDLQIGQSDVQPIKDTTTKGQWNFAEIRYNDKHFVPLDIYVQGGKQLQMSLNVTHINLSAIPDAIDCESNVTIFYEEA